MGTYFGIPQIKIAIDDYMLLYDGPAKESFEFDIPLDDGNHELKIVHHGKTVDDHLVDDRGQIIQDKFVEIQRIWMDGVELQQELWTARFFPVYMHKADHEPYYISPNLYLGHNGSWIMDFATPALIWLINLRQPGPSLDGTIFKTSRQVLQEMKQAFMDLPDV
jgi:hypothetical protein